MSARPEPVPTWQRTPVPLPSAGIPIIGRSAAMQRALGLALRFAPTDLPVLLVGPTGAGKELFARQIHEWSRRPGPLVDVNAGALPREMIESLLFGHRRGAFTGANQSAEGLVLAAGQGTLFLDELSSLPIEGQAKLLRVLESGEVRPLGATANSPVRCRFVAAVQEDVDARLARGEFRLDLYQRLAGAVIRLPALAERREDIAPLARHFAEERGCALAPEAEARLLDHPWPGNVRELRAAVHRAVLLADAQVVSAETMHEAIELCAPRPALPVARRDTPTGHGPLIALCRAHDWDVGKAAAALGIGRSTLYRRLRDSGVDPNHWRMVERLEAWAPEE